MRPPVSKADVPAAKRRNAEAAADWVRRIVASTSPSPRLIVFPVHVLTGGNKYSKEITTDDVSVEIEGPELGPLRDVCAEANCYVVSTVVERIRAFPGRVFHTAFVLGPAGVVLRSPKAASPSAPGVTVLRDFRDQYRAEFGPDSILPVAQTEIGTIGCLLEREVFSAEAGRLLRRKGADVIVHPTGQVAGAELPWLPYKQTTGYSNGVYVLSATRSREIVTIDGVERETWQGGTSTIVGPDGRLLASVGPHGEGAVCARIDPNEIARARQEQDMWTSPAPGLFASLYAE